MPDPRAVGLHELRTLIDRLNEANLRVSSAGAHFSLLPPASNGAFEELSDIKLTIEEDLLPRCFQLLEKLETGGIGN